MDAFAGYGSDDSSLSEKETAGGVAALAAYSGGSSSSEENKEPETKRPRMDNKKTKTIKEPYQLPPPDTNNTESMIVWSRDYTPSPEKENDSSSEDVNENKDQQLLDKLKQLQQQQQGSDAGWAAHLALQHDFTNPRFFDRAGGKLGIQDNLGSNITAGAVVWDWEESVVAREEKARLKQQEGEQAAVSASAFVQDQLGRAMQM